MPNPKFRGSFPVLVTPFAKDHGGVDETALRRLVEWQIESGAPGLIVLGTTGEFVAVDDAERAEVVAISIDQANGRAPVLVGATHASTAIAARYAREAEEAGAAGLMIAPPYYYTPTEEEIFRHYAAICEATSLPIMLYNNPYTTNVDMTVPLVVRMAKAFDNIAYIKEASMDVGRVYDITRRGEGAMHVFAGERIVESFLLGAVGYVNPHGNYAPRASTRIWEFLEQGRIEEASAIQDHLEKIDHIVAEGHPTYGHQCYSKAMAAAMGRPVGDVRPPLARFSELGEEGRKRLDKLKAVLKELEALVDRFETRAA